MQLLASVATPFAESTHVPVVEDDALVSEAGPTGSVGGITSHKATSDQISVYVVREGDTLSQIAEMFGVTVNTIKWGNDLSSNSLQTGSTLVILPISGVKHTVAKGDTLASLAKKYKADVEEIADYNSLSTGSKLAVGSTIIIPDGEVVPTASGSTHTHTSSGSTSGLKTYEGYYLRPVVGGTKTQGIHGYNGIDIGAKLGTRVLASASGEVIISRSGGWNGGYGNYVVIKHSNGTQTLYAHLNSTSVSAGDSVNQGEVIGTMGSTGKSTGVHLHFEIRGAKNPF